MNDANVGAPYNINDGGGPIPKGDLYEDSSSVGLYYSILPSRYLHKYK